MTHLEFIRGAVELLHARFHEGDDRRLIGLGLGDHAVIVNPVALDLGILGRDGAPVEGDGNGRETQPSRQSCCPEECADLDAGGDREITDLPVTPVIDLPIRKPALSRSPNSFFDS